MESPGFKQRNLDPEWVVNRLSCLAREEGGALAALARAEGLGPEDAIDCVQEALSAMLVGAKNGTLPVEPSEWGAFLAGTVRNVARNGRRRHFRARPHESLDPEMLVDVDARPADEIVARAEQHIRLRGCVEELCEIQKAVITLRMLEERPGEDVARALGISSGHVAVLLHRAKAALRVCLTESDTRLASDRTSAG